MTENWEHIDLLSLFILLSVTLDSSNAGSGISSSQRSESF